MLGTVRRTAIIALGLLLAAGLALALSPEVRTGAMTALLLPELFNAPGPRPLALLTAPPQRTERRFGGADADLYKPSNTGRHGALVMTLGVHPLDKRDATVVRVAEGLARTGLVVLVVQSHAALADRIEPAEADDLVEAVEDLRADDAIVDPKRIGLLGFSAGASLAFLAATDPRIAADVHVLVWVGGFADASQLLRQIAARQFIDDGASVPWQPADLAVYAIRKQLVDGLPDPDDREKLTAMYLADLGRGQPGAQDQLAGLSPDARALAALFDADDPATVDRQVAALPPTVTQRIDALSPIRTVDRFQGRAFILVDRADPLVPYLQSRELARALPPSHLGRYVELAVLDHVQPTRSVPLATLVPEAWKLASLVYAVLRALDPAT